MKNPIILYEGSAHLYLQGKNVLLAIGDTKFEFKNVIRFAIGDIATNIFINEHRTDCIQKAINLLRNNIQSGLENYYNQSAWVKVQYSEAENYVEIDIWEERAPTSLRPVLWMGLLTGNQMPGYVVEWEIFSEVDSQTMAFVSLIAPAISPVQSLALTVG